MLLCYYHDSAMSEHLGACETFAKIATKFCWSRISSEVYNYVRKCDLYQRAKPAQDASVGLHATNPCCRPMGRLFIDFVGPLTRLKRGNIGIFFLFVSFFPVRKISSQAVLDCLERWYFPAFGSPTWVVSDNASVFFCKQFRDLCFRWVIAHITTSPYYPTSSLTVIGFSF